MASDQTPEGYKQLAAASPEGTAVFLRVDASGETTVLFEQNLTYQQCVAAGQEFLAFKWIPATVSSFEAVVNSRCRLAGEACAVTCDADGCLCDTRKHQCVDASGNSNLPPNTNESSSGNQIDEPKPEFTEASNYAEIYEKFTVR
jgi:hypothetical protein